MLPGHKKLQIVEAFQRRPFIVRKECICEVSFLLQFWIACPHFHLLPGFSTSRPFDASLALVVIEGNVTKFCPSGFSRSLSAFATSFLGNSRSSVGVPGGTGRGAGCWAGKRWLHLCFPGRAEPRPGSPSEPLPRFVAVLFVWAVFSCAKNGLCSAQVLSSVCPCLAGPDSKDELIWITRSYFHLV